MILQTIITTDRTWLWNYDLKTKEPSGMWMRSGSPPLCEGPRNKQRMQNNVYLFADTRVMIFMYAVPKGATVNAGNYSKVIALYV